MSSIHLSTGNVGIGTTVPNTQLDISGNISCTGTVSAGSSMMFRNKIINGNFDIWQRGTSFNITANDTYTADRWTIVYDGSGATRTVSRQAFTLGQTNVPDEPTYFLRFNQSVAGSGAIFNVLLQRIESVRTLAGQTATVSFYAKADTTQNIVIIYYQVFGTGGSPSSTVGINAGNFSLTTSWRRFTLTTTLPSIAGKTLGTNNNDFLSFEFQLPKNTTFTIDIAQVQVEKGTIATPFELRPLGVELQLCQRYYEKSYLLTDAPGTITDTHSVVGRSVLNGNMFGYFTCIVEKRISITPIIYSTNNGSTGYIYGIDTSVNYAATCESGTKIFAAVSTVPNYNAYRFHWVATAEL